MSKSKKSELAKAAKAKGASKRDVQILKKITSEARQGNIGPKQGRKPKKSK